MKELIPFPQRVKYFNHKYASEFVFRMKVLESMEIGQTLLSLGQFIPCLNGKPLDKPNGYENLIWHINNAAYPFDGLPEVVTQCKEYETALSKVLFKGWELENSDTRLNCFWIKHPTKENLLNFIEGKIANFMVFTTIESISHLNLPLTKEGQKRML